MLISNLGFKIKKNKRMNCDLFEREWVCYLFCGSFLSLQRTFHMISLAWLFSENRKLTRGIPADISHQTKVMRLSPDLFNQSKAWHFLFTIVKFFSEKSLFCEVFLVKKIEWDATAVSLRHSSVWYSLLDAALKSWSQTLDHGVLFILSMSVSVASCPIIMNISFIIERR